MAGSEPDAPKPTTLKRIERWVWILIYGGMLAISLSLFLPTPDGATSGLGTLLQIGGGLALVAGIGLILLRSRWR